MNEFFLFAKDSSLMDIIRVFLIFSKVLEHNLCI